MGMRPRATKDVTRLRLRREVIRVLADESLARVQGGWGGGCTTSGDSGDGETRSVCVPSK
jgi:hypothetical protein